MLRRFLPFKDCVKWVQAMGLWDSQAEWEEPLGKHLLDANLELCIESP